MVTLKNIEKRDRENVRSKQRYGAPFINAKGISNINAAAIVSGIGDKRQFIQL